MKKSLLYVGLLVVLAAVTMRLLPPGGRGAEKVPVNAEAPRLSGEAAQGEAPYRRSCAECHGETAAGSGKGPPLVHEYYAPGQFSDEAFMRAIVQGARQHHWDFGDMKPVAGVSNEDARRIIAYVRAVQRANGIE